MRTCTPVIFAFSVVAITSSVQAAIVKNISTGINDATGLQLANNSPDTDFVVATGSAADVGVTPIARSTPIPVSYMTDATSTSSRWIAINSGEGLEGLSVPQGNYFLQTTVNLNGFDPSSALIPTSRYGADDGLIGIFINGTSVYSQSQVGQFTSFVQLPDNLGLGKFQAGVNTLQFEILNQSGVDTDMAFRLEGTVTANPVPEPGTLFAEIPRVLALLNRRARKMG